MRIKIADIGPNPFRDFDLYPIDEEQVRRLRQSIGQLGFFSGVTARRANKTDLLTSTAKFRLAAGHHRLEAVKLHNTEADEPLNEIEAVVEDYTDEEMVAVMTLENLTQRGHNAGAQADSVAAYSSIVAKAILLGDEVGKFLPTSESSPTHVLVAAQAMVAEHGPGVDVIYRAINTFDRKARKPNKDAEIATETEIKASLAMLKGSGMMGNIVANALEYVNIVRAARDRSAKLAEEARRLAEEKAEAERVKAEAKAKADHERRVQEAEADAQRTAAAQAKAAQADAAHKARAEKEARETETRRKDAEKKREIAEKAAQAERDERERQREQTRKANEQREAEAAAEKERRKKEADTIKAQKALDQIYDPRCVHVFRLTSHEAAFRKEVLSENGRRFIPIELQFKLAEKIRAEINPIEKKRGMDLGSYTIAQLVKDQIEKAMHEQKKIDKEERDRLLRNNHVERVKILWATIRRGQTQSETALLKLLEEQKNWPWAKDFFPMDTVVIEEMGKMLTHFNTLRKKLGL